MLQGQLLVAMQENDMERFDSLNQVANGIMRRALDNNSDNLVGVYFFGNLYNEMEPQEAREILNKFPEQMQKTQILTAIAKSIAAQENTEIGKPYLEIALPDSLGETVSVTPLIGPGKWVLIDFWATWCSPCRGELPYLKEAFKEFGPKGFNIYGVSLDNDAESWKEFLVKEEMTWPNVIAVTDGKSAPIVEEYGIRSIPTNFLISPEGKIVAKDLRGEGIKEKLAQLVK